MVPPSENRENGMVYGWFEDMTFGDADTIGEYLADKTEMVDFARKWDPFPFHIDRAEAEQSIHGGLIASGVFGVIAALLVEIPYITKD